MDIQENGQGRDPSNTASGSTSNDQPALPIKKEEPMDDYDMSNIDELKRRLRECQRRARNAEEELQCSNQRELNLAVRSAENEQIRVSVEHQMLLLQREKREEIRTAEAEKAKALKEYQRALASSTESARIAEAVKFENRRLEEELGKSKADLERERKESNGKLNEMRELEMRKADKFLEGVMEKHEEDFESARKEWSVKLRESERERAKLEESLRRERERDEERSKENSETQKRLVESISTNEDLKERLKKLTEEMEILELSLADARSKADHAETRATKSERKLRESMPQAGDGKKRLSWSDQSGAYELIEQQRKRRDEEEARLKEVIERIEKELMEAKAEIADANVKLAKETAALEDMRKVNGLLATTDSGKIHSELVKARKHIEHLEKEAVRVGSDIREEPLQTPRSRREEAVRSIPIRNADVTPRVSWAKVAENDQTLKRKRRLEASLAIDMVPKPVLGHEMEEAGTSETVESTKTRRSGRLAKPVTYTDSSKDSDEERPTKRSRVESAKKLTRNRSTTPSRASRQCVLCEVCPKTAIEYAWHLRNQHNSSLEQNGLYLICSCQYEVRVEHPHPKHSGKCNGGRFTIHKLNGK